MGRIPSRWRRVRDGVSQAGDRAITLTPEGEKMHRKRRRRPDGLQLILPATWQPVEPENIGLAAGCFSCLIRRRKDQLI